ncbi:MAG: 3-oxo-5-alpha-steroid 4-dehydrogenase [Spirochaetales bacterium]|nr:3-oxo-5-alpha-steroid 4-dehydrogenase [Spirochaetales bacterium]
MILQHAYRIVLITIFSAAAITFVSLMFVRAPYGRYTRNGWGPMVRARVAWIVMEAPAVFVILIFYSTGTSMTTPLTIFILLWQTHYVYRTFIYPLLMRGARKGFPVALILMAMVFNGANGFVNGYHLFHAENAYPVSWLVDPRFLIGVFLFFWGMYVHIRCDHILRNLRGPEDTDYRIPYGSMYRFVSAPNYFGEIVQWCGWALATWSLAGLSFAVFTAANLIPRALSHHKWYARTFPEYPKNRKAVLPFVM